MSYLSIGSDLSIEPLLAFGFSPGPVEMLFILGIALLLYGGRLPEMARTWGKTFAELRRGLSGIQNDFNDAMHSTKEQLTYQPENDPYLNDTVNETSGYDEALQDDEVLQEDEYSEDSTSDSDSADETSNDSESTEELSAEKKSDIDTD